MVNGLLTRNVIFQPRTGSNVRPWLMAAAVLLSIGAVVNAGAQTLTAEQMRMVDQLPAEQRQQAIDALQQLQQADGSAVGEPVRESTESQRPAASTSPFASPVAKEIYANANNRLVITSTPKNALTVEELAALDQDQLLSRVQGSHTFALDDIGVLSLFGVESIALLGLSEADIERRLSAEPIFAPFDVSVHILATQPTGIEALQAFGYSVFESQDSSFDPAMTGPVPPDYVLGPGDTVRVQFFGNISSVYELDVTRNGVINLPNVGPMTVVGLPFSEFRRQLDQRVSEMLIGTQVSITMGQLRTIRVFVLGDTNRPGSYIVSSLATISSALYRSGGISRVGSLRNIQLKRSGAVSARLDLYDLLLSGDTSGDVRLQQGDVIFIPPIGAQVSVSGAVNRPAIYELRGKSTVAGVIGLAGGLRADAFAAGGRIVRIDAGEERIVLGIDVGDSDGRNTAVQAGDVLTVPRVLPDLADTVTLLGHVRRSGPFQWRDGMRLVDLVGSLAELRPGADSDYVLIRREDPESRRISVLSANLTTAVRDHMSVENVALQSRDTVYVFSLAFGRDRVVQPILDELKLQSRFDAPFQEVSISGHVKAPGMFPLESGMRVSDLIRAGGRLAEQAYTLKAELVRYEVLAGDNRTTTVIDIDLASVLQGNELADLALEEHDNLRISRVPDWDSMWTVELLGEVVFPGQYRIRRGETLRQLLDRAGGLSNSAFAQGTVFLRESLRLREQEQIALLERRMQADLNALSLEDRDSLTAESLGTAQSLLEQLHATKSVGRLVIDLEQLAARKGENELVNDIELRDGDQVMVPKRAQEVTVIGETQQNTSHLFQAGLTLNDYIQMSGGPTRRADEKLIYVVRASGAVVSAGKSRWFGRRGGPEINPGDTIVVPLEIDRVRRLALWASVTQILYQSAIAVAAVKSFSD